MKLIDIHTHIYPDEIARKATDSIRNFYQIGGANNTDGTVRMLLDRGGQAGISQYVILPVAIRPDRVQGINNFIHEKAQEYDCMIPFGTVHAAMEGMAEEVERIFAMGMKGIKLHPDSSQFAIDDPRLFPMYEAIEGKIPILLHMGDRRYDYSHPARLRRVLDLFPKLDAIAAHFGGYSMYETACQLLRDTNCFMDVSSSMMFMEEGVAEHYINLYGAERMMFGTDYPLWDPLEETERFLRLRLTPDQMEQIGHKTAEIQLGL